MAQNTPMMKQYRRIKASVGDAILLFRLGDFYEMFMEDAHRASRILEIALTARHTIPMCGIPYHSVSRYIARLLQAGQKVAICDQVEDPRSAQGIVKREVTRIITPGTVLEEDVLSSNKNNYLTSIQRLGQVYGLAYLDLSTGEFQVTELSSLPDLINELARIQPSECLLPEKLDREIASALRPRLEETVFTPLEEWLFDYDQAYDTLKKQFQVTSLDGFGAQELLPAIGAAGAALQYIGENLRSALPEIHSFSVYSTSEYVILDSVSRRNLELVEPMRGGNQEATLFGVLDRTLTPMGSRTLRRWILQPLVRPEAVNRRLEGVEELTKKRDQLRELRAGLKEIRDMERISVRISCGSSNARELVNLRDSLEMVPRIREEVSRLEAAIWEELVSGLQFSPDLLQVLRSALVEAPPLTVKEGGMIKPGYNSRLDELRTMARSGKDWIALYQSREIERTGIKSLKVRYNKVFGYYLEVTRANLSSVPSDYIRKQTLVNAERFITDELKRYENQVLGAEQKAAVLEYEIFENLREEVRRQSSLIQICARALGRIDTLAALAEVAGLNDYVRPRMDSTGLLRIINGRHPVVEQIQTEDRFVGNDTLLDDEENQILIITGPNMAGKSTYIRQVALIVLMAQMGSFIPADSARIGMTDRIFTRVGAADDLTRGQSTFMVEMTETANILRHATPRSLIILDEIGRGTSTFDGISIAWAVAEYLHNHPPSRARTLFATHYHELTELTLTLPRVKNYNVAVKEWNDRVIFLRKVVPGGTDKSYGIQVARLAGVPRVVIERAEYILSGLESGTLSEEGLPKFAVGGSTSPPPSQQLYLFPERAHPLLRELKNMNLEHITPFEALQRLRELKEQASE